MRASRGMGDIAPSKIPKSKSIVRKSAPQFAKGYKKGGQITQLAEGGESKVNAAGNYTKPEMRKRIFSNVKSAAIAGTGAGQWSARKAQVVAKRYKAAGGSYK